MSSEPPSPVAIESDSGVLSLTAPLDVDHDIASSSFSSHSPAEVLFTLVVAAQDHGLPPRHAPSPFTLRVRVGDVNDNGPVFGQPFYIVEVVLWLYITNYNFIILINCYLNNLFFRN